MKMNTKKLRRQIESHFHFLVAILLFVTVGPGYAETLNIAPSWNLLGYSEGLSITVADTFGNSSNVITVWKWNSSTAKWAFFSPALSDGGNAYASSKGYDFLTSINSGEGFWVNAKISFSATTLPPAVCTSPQVLLNGICITPAPTTPSQANDATTAVVAVVAGL
jgi:hypothetical protein